MKIIVFVYMFEEFQPRDQSKKRKRKQKHRTIFISWQVDNSRGTNWFLDKQHIKAHQFQLSYSRGYGVGFWFLATKIMCYFNLELIQQFHRGKNCILIPRNLTKHRSKRPTVNRAITLCRTESSFIKCSIFKNKT